MNLSSQQALKYLNLAREYPKYYVTLIDEQINSFVDDINIKLETDILYETFEGKTAWEEAKKFIINQPPLRAFDYHQGLTQAAYDHAQDMMKNQINGHKGSDESTFVQRIQRYCKKAKGNLIQLLGNIHPISNKNGIELAILNLIIDDGVSNRSHRKALFSKDYKYVGIEFAVNKERIISVVTLTQNNLQLLKSSPQNIGTSTSHLKTYNELSPQTIRERVLKNEKQKQNCSNLSQNAKSCLNANRKCARNSDDLWTFKKMANESIMSSNYKLSQQEQYFNEPLCKQTSIFKQFNQSAYLKNSSRISKEGSGDMSQIHKLQITSTLNSPFIKSNAFSSGFGSTNNNKKIIEKKQTMRSWNQDEFVIKQVTTAIKYSDGSIEDFVEKHSVLKNTCNQFKQQRV